MKKEKKQTILDVLESGIVEKVSVSYAWGKTPCKKVTNDFGTYVFSDKEAIVKKERSISRKIANQLNFGDERGKIGIWRENSTAKKLAELQGDFQDCRRHYKMFLEAMKAPKNLRKYVYENIREWMKEHDVNSLNKNIPFDIAEILPPAWRKGFENEDLFGFQTEFQLDDLLPAAGFEIGKEVVARYDGDWRVGKIVGYKYFGEKFSSLYRKRYGRYVIWYDVQFGENRWNHADFKLKELSFNFAEAV